MIRIDAMFAGGPKTIVDEAGEWRTSIFREPRHGPVALGPRGLEGDSSTDTKHHGSPDQAVCCHDIGHYEFWNSFYGLAGEARIGPGSLGENWTLSGAPEAEVFVGDVYRVGGALVQATAPRYPCSKQERRTRLQGLVERTKETGRSGFYLRVLEPGTVSEGDALVLEARPWPGFSLQSVFRCLAGACDPGKVREMLEIPELSSGWRKMLAELYPAAAGA